VCASKNQKVEERCCALCQLFLIIVQKNLQKRQDEYLFVNQHHLKNYFIHQLHRKNKLQTMKKASVLVGSDTDTAPETVEIEVKIGKLLKLITFVVNFYKHFAWAENEPLLNFFNFYNT
jgi:hypothetical protein